MQPSSFQYQPINIQKGLTKTPNFLNNKILDKSAPNIINNRPSGFVPNQLSKETDFNQNPNKSTYIPKKD